MNEIVLTEKEQAEALHKQIIGYGEVIYQSLYGMCTAIKQMRDSKLYRAFGFDTFEAYTEEKIGMKRRQAYSYIAIAEKLSEDFVQSTAQIGVQKLYLLTTADEETRTEIIQSTDLTDTTVKELREQLAKLREESELDRKERDNANAAAQRWKDTAKRVQEERERAEAAAEEAKAAQETTRVTLRNLLEKKAEQVKRLEAQVQELESRPADVAVVDHTEEIDRLNAEIAQLRQQLAEKPDMQLPLGVEPIYQQDTKAVFKPYLTAAVDSFNRLTAFIEQSAGDDNLGFFIEKAEAALTIVSDRIAKLKGA